MLLKSFALLFLAVALVAAQDAAEQTTRTRTAANRRTKLFEESQAQQAEKVTATGQRRRLVAKTKVNAAAKAVPTTPTTTAPTTTTTEAVVVTEPVFQESETVVEEQQSAEEQEAPQLPAFRPRPAAVPVRTVTQEVQSELPAFRPRSRPAARPVIVDESEEEEVVPTARPRPVAGPTRARAQVTPAVPVSRPQVQVQVAEEAPVRLSVDGKLPRTRTSVVSEQVKQAPVETVRRYSFENEDGSFTFGYENADGSFKEETRGVDCIVRGKYGYVDPDGVKREFTYQTGNQCVPGQNNNEEEELEDDDEEERPAPVRRPNVPARRPNIPAERRPNVPAVERRPVNVAQVQDEEEEISQVLSTPTRITRPTNTGTTQQRAQAPRPVEQPAAPAPRPRPAAPVQQIVDFDSEVGRFQQPETQQRPRPAAPQARPIFNDDDDHDVFVERRPAPPARAGTGLRSFSTELVFDRNTNQFQSALEQRIPETNEEVSIRERLIAFSPFTSTTPAPLLPRVPQTQTVQRPQPVQQTVQQRPQTDFVPTQNFNSLTLNDQERLRQLQEIRRAETEAQRLREERQRIDEQNRQAQNTPAVTFGAPPRTQQTFQAPQQTTQTFRAPQPQFQFRPVVANQGPTSFATGQIDSFLSSLG